MGEGFLNARQAAAYIGYEPGVDSDGRPRPTSQDKAMRAFYEFVRRHRVETHHRGRRLLFRRVDLDRAINRCTDARQHSALEEMEELARRHARGERVRSIAY